MKNIKKVGMMLGVFALMVLSTALPVLAATGEFSTGSDFTQIFQTKGFVGNAEILTKLSFVSALVSDIISICGFIGVSLTVIRLMLSLLYLSNPVIFDEIDELKQASLSVSGVNKESAKSLAGYFLLPGGSNTFSKAKGGIFDTIVYFLLSHMPNVKNYSDFKEGSENSMDKTNITAYVLKVSPKIIMQIFFFSIAWNGVLMQAYGSVVDAMGVAAERVVTDDFSVFVNNALNSGLGHSFPYITGTDSDKFKASVAKSVYNKATQQLQASQRSQKNYDLIGAYIEQHIVKEMDEATLKDIATQGTSSSTGNTEADIAWDKVTWENAGDKQLSKSDCTVVNGATYHGDSDEDSKKYSKVVSYTDGNYYAVASDGDNYVAGYKVSANKAKTTDTSSNGLAVSDEVYKNLKVTATFSETNVRDTTVNDWTKTDIGYVYCWDIANNAELKSSIKMPSTGQGYVICAITFSSNSVGTNYWSYVDKSE